MANADLEREVLRHAGLEAPGGADGDKPRLADFESLDRPAFDAAMDDFFALLAQLNTELNGEPPSETAYAEKHQSVSRSIAYAVVVILQELRERAGRVTAERAAELREAAWTVEMAWSQVLAGDIDDLRQEVEWARAPNLTPASVPHPAGARRPERQRRDDVK